jgi:hypothetical protein
MGNADIYPSLDLEIALQKLHRLQLEDGDLGAQYWLQISLLLKDAAQLRQRALSAEQKLDKIQNLLSSDDLAKARNDQSVRGVNGK